MLFITISSLFICIALIIGLTLYLILISRSSVVDRLEKIIPKREVTTKGLLREEMSPFQAFLSKIGVIMPLQNREQHKYTQLLIAGGFRKESLYTFLGSKIILAFSLPLLFMIFYTIPRGIALNRLMLLLELALAIIGFLAPSLWLQRKVKNRSTEIFHTLPDILDLLTVCVEAGISIDSAMAKTTDSPQFSKNPLAQEMKFAGMETRAGKPRADALRDMADRTMVADVKSLISMLIQTERFGTSLSQALRVHSDSLRTKRRQLAEEAAAKTSIKMLFPLVIFVFPSMLIVILGPALITIFKALK